MLPEKYKAMPDKEVFSNIRKIKKELGDKILILGHHYQRDEVIQFADKIGDSLKLSIEASKSNSPYIVFCGVKFMAETADIITKDYQSVLLPDLEAGCPMADMATVSQINKAWRELGGIIDIKKMIPITYVNSSAETKAFCGTNNGITCTSSNAEDIIKSVLFQKKKIFFLPDKNLSINIAKKLGIKREKILIWEREKDNGGLLADQIKDAEIIVWNGYCPVHMRFNKGFTENLKEKNPDIQILVHPEVPEEVADIADFMGSTQYIINKINKAPKNTSWAIGTEIHLVSRLMKNYPDKNIHFLDKTSCMCSTMYRISSRHLLWVIQNLINGKVVNKIQVPTEISLQAEKALNKMFALSG